MKTLSHNIIKKEAHFFLNLNTPQELSKLLYFQFWDIVEQATTPKYSTFSIPKKSGGERIIESPDNFLKQIQGRLNHFLQCVYHENKHPASFGFNRRAKEDPHKSGIISNASLHTGKKWVMNLDLSDFFHTISGARVKNLFLSSPFSFDENLASCLALLCVYNKKLPMGAPTSPVLSNFICLNLDQKLAALAQKNGINYSRYADDLSFSSDIHFSKDVMQEILAIVKEENFLINPKKSRIQSNNVRQEVTGLTVNEKVNINRSYIRNIRSALHQLKLNLSENNSLDNFKMRPDLSPYPVNSLLGRIEFIGQVRGQNDRIYNRFKEECLNIGLVH